MPVVSVVRDELFKRMGTTMTDDEFGLLCFQFGIELDDITSEKEQKLAQRGLDAASEAASSAEMEALSEEVLYKIDIPANRYDLLCLEGIARALMIYQGKEPTPSFTVTPGNEVMKVLPETRGVRPFVVCALLRDISFTESSYQSFIELQEKLHQNICRQRTLVAIGTHDYDTLQGPFTYEARRPEDISFVPLNEERSFNARELFHYYKEEKKQNNLKQYLHIVEASPVYPCIYDAAGTLLSLPPIINGEHSKIKLSTKNVFVECTATDLTKAHIVLNTVCAMFSEHCKTPFAVEAVRVEYTDADAYTTPTMAVQEFKVDPASICRGIGADVPAADMVELLGRMQLPTTLTADGQLSVSAPPTRSDVLHACDIQEDVAIAKGYDNIKRTMPPTVSVGREFPLNKLTDGVRQVVAQAGYLETLTFILCSREENFEWLRRPQDEKLAVVLDKPKSDMFKVARTSLLPGVLNTLRNNKGLVKIQNGIRVFECGDVVLLDDQTDVGARNERHVVAVYGGLTSGFEHIHGLLDRIMESNEAAFEYDDPALAQSKKKPKHTYRIEAAVDATFFPGRCADVFLDDKKVGTMGILHPEVLQNFQITHPVSAVELNIEPFL